MAPQSSPGVRTNALTHHAGGWGESAFLFPLLMFSPAECLHMAFVAPPWSAWRRGSRFPKESPKICPAFELLPSKVTDNRGGGATVSRRPHSHGHLFGDLVTWGRRQARENLDLVGAWKWGIEGDTLGAIIKGESSRDGVIDNRRLSMLTYLILSYKTIQHDFTCLKEKCTRP